MTFVVLHSCKKRIGLMILYGHLPHVHIICLNLSVSLSHTRLHARTHACTHVCTHPCTQTMGPCTYVLSNPEANGTCDDISQRERTPNDYLDNDCLLYPVCCALSPRGRGFFYGIPELSILPGRVVGGVLAMVEISSD